MIRRIGRYSFWAGAVALAFVVVVTSVFVWRLSEGPVSVRFLNPWITSALGGQDTGITIKFEETILVWSSERNSLDVHLVNISFEDESGMPLSAFPEAGIEFSGAALLNGMLAPSRLELFGPKLAMGRMADGTISFGGAPIRTDDSPPDQGAILILLGELLSRPSEDSVTGYLDEIAISGAEFSFMDRPSNTYWEIADAQLSLIRTESGIMASLFGEVEVKGQLWTISASGDYSLATGVIHVTLDVEDIEPFVLANETEAFAALRAIHFPISGTLEADITKDGKIIGATADLIGGSGYIDLPQYYPNGFEISAVELRARYVPDGQTMIIEHGSIAIEETVVDIEGYIAFEEDGVETNVQGTLANVPAAELFRFWPLGVGTKTRTWLRDNITAGLITEGDYWVKILSDREKGPLTSDEIEVNFAFEDLTGHYARPMAPLTHSNGRATYAGASLDLYLDQSNVNGLRLTDGHLVIDGITQKRPKGIVDAVLVGTLKDTLSLIDSEPIRALSRSGFSADGVRGEAATRTHLEFPLGAGVKADDILYAAASTVTNAYIPKITDKIWMDNGNLLVQVNSDGLVAEGDAELNGVSMKAKWSLNFKPVDELRATYELVGTMDVESLKTLDIDLSNYLEGDVAFTANISQMTDGMMHIGVDADTEGALISLPLPGWGKPIGEPGQLHVDVAWRQGGELNLNNLVISSADLNVEGNMRFDAETVIQEANFPVLRFGLSELMGTIENTGGTHYKAVLKGPTYDAGPLLQELFVGEEGVDTGSSDPYEADILIDFGSVLVGEGVDIRNFKGAARIENDFWTDTRFDGELNGTAMFAIAIEDTGPDERLLRIETHDASTFLRGLGYFDGGEGGVLNFAMKMHEAGEESRNVGRVIIDDFRIRDMPALGKLLSLGSLTGLGEVMAGEGISFKRLQAPFVYDKKSFKVVEARAFGAALGFTLSGEVDRVNRSLDFSGTIVPAYSINSVLGNIPIIGLLFVGEEGSGVFAISFQAVGPLDEPVFSVNPLSALTPGFLRGITSILDPQAPSPKVKEGDEEEEESDAEPEEEALLQ